MGILGIENRTENWKTVEHFHGLSKDAKLNLIRTLSGIECLQSDTVQVELFWYGLRDYIESTDRSLNAGELRRKFNQLFPCLKTSVEAFRADRPPYTFNELREGNYNGSEEQEADLFDNLRNTEIDIAIESQTHLFIGEAKHESPLNTNGSYVLVHQLIRQFVMAKILVDVSGQSKMVVPFIVGNSKETDGEQGLRNTVQVKFMIERRWLPERNILSWDAVKELTQS